MLSVALCLAAQTGDVVAVFELQDKREDKLPTKKLTAMTGYFRKLLAEGGAMRVVPDADLRQAMADQKVESYDQCYDEACQIALGKAVAASKVVSTEIIQIGRECIVGSEVIDLRSESTDRAHNQKGGCDEEALGALLEKLAVKIRAGRALAEVDAPPPPGEWDPRRTKKVIASFQSDPAGAIVLIDGELACQDTSRGCKRTLTRGAHRVAMQMERYLPREEQVIVDEGTEVLWELEPNFGLVMIRTEPSNLEIEIDGRPAGRTPAKPSLAPGEHTVELVDRCFYRSRQSVTVVRGNDEDVVLDARPREGAVDVSAVDASGNAQDADVFVDGHLAGRAPDVIKVSVCAARLEVRNDAYGSYQRDIAVGERQTLEVEAKLEPAAQPTYDPWESGGVAPPPPPSEAETPPAAGVGIRIGVQAIVGLLCLEAQESGGKTSCVDTMPGYGGLVSLQFPTHGIAGWFIRAAIRGGFLYYTKKGASVTLYEIPASAAGEIGIAGVADVTSGMTSKPTEYLIGVEALYAFRKITSAAAPILVGDATIDGELVARHDALLAASPHSVDLGAYLAIRMFGLDVGGGIYGNVVGLGESILVRIWLGYAFDL